MAGRASESYFEEPRKCRVIVLEELNYLWDEWELEEIAACWKEGINVVDIARRYKRDPDEVLLALIHLARERKIKQRENGLKGMTV